MNAETKTPINTKPVKVRRALASVFDKKDLQMLALRLSKVYGVEILSTGGTYDKLNLLEGVRLREVSDYTGFPEIMNGRVKTLHPRVHGGILAMRDNEDHQRQMSDNGIEYIDMVIVNLYPFNVVADDPNSTSRMKIENIDIGGPAMIRGAAKNFEHVVVLVDPADYQKVLLEMDHNDGCVLYETRYYLARKAFEHTSAYDAAITLRLFSGALRQGQ